MPIFLAIAAAGLLGLWYLHTHSLLSGGGQNPNPNPLPHPTPKPFDFDYRGWQSNFVQASAPEPHVQMSLFYNNPAGTVQSDTIRALSPAALTAMGKRLVDQFILAGRTPAPWQPPQPAGGGGGGAPNLPIIPIGPSNSGGALLIQVGQQIKLTVSPPSASEWWVLASDDPSKVLVPSAVDSNGVALLIGVAPTASTKVTANQINKQGKTLTSLEYFVVVQGTAPAGGGGTPGVIQ